MNAFLEKLIDKGFMTEGQGEYIENSVIKKDSFIISGHKGWGILPLMAAISAIAKGSFKIKQVKSFDDLQGEADYLILADIKDIDYGKLVEDAILIENTSFISLKDPDHPYSIYKILGDIYKTGVVTDKIIQVIECAKVNDENKLVKITKITVADNGKVKKADFKE